MCVVNNVAELPLSLLLCSGHVADNSKTTPPNVYVSGDGGYSWRLVTILLLLAKFLMSVGKCTCSFEGNTYYEVFCAVVKYMYV